MSQRICSVEDCGKDAHCRGWCPMHYQRVRRFGSLDPVFPPKKPRPKRIGVETCEIGDCDKVQKARGWCAAHWSRWKRFGSPNHQVRGEVVNGRRICPHCRAAVLVEDWYVTPAGRFILCRECFGEWNRQRGHSRRATPDGVERFTRREILNRDNWRCQLCDQQIDPTLAHPDPMSASLDHIIPIARGGIHARSNCQAAHRICNMRKWANLPS